MIEKAFYKAGLSHWLFNQQDCNRFNFNGSRQHLKRTTCVSEWFRKCIKKEVIKENEPYYDEGNYLCLVQISDSEINKT